MKKKYIEPQMEVVKIKAANMLCGSQMNVNIAPEPTGGQEVTPEYLEELFGAGDAW